MEVPLQYLLNILKVGVLEKVSISNTQNPKAVNPSPADDKNCLLNSDNLTQAIEMQLYEEKKSFF